jgi:hypothetical protein
VQKAIAGTRYLGRSWETSVEYVEGLLKPGSEGTYSLVDLAPQKLTSPRTGINHGIEQDGRVALLTVKEY